MRTVIIGVGNPVLRDDSVGLRVARELRERVRGASVSVLELCGGGMRLMEAMAGFDVAIVIDAIESGGRPGTIHRLEPGSLPQTRSINSTHEGSLAAALELGRATGLRIPAEIRIWAVEAADTVTFSESLSPAVEKAVQPVVDDVLRSLRA